MNNYILRVTVDSLTTNKREVDYRVEVIDKEEIRYELKELGQEIESGDYPFRSESPDDDDD